MVGFSVRIIVTGRIRSSEWPPLLYTERGGGFWAFAHYVVSFWLAVYSLVAYALRSGNPCGCQKERGWGMGWGGLLNLFLPVLCYLVWVLALSVVVCKFVVFPLVALALRGGGLTYLKQ